MTGLDVAGERSGSAVILHVQGELDLATAAILRDAAAAELATGGFEEIVVDLGELTFLDSTGLGCLVEIRNRAVAAGLTMRVDPVSGNPGRIIEIAGLNRLFGLPERPREQ